MYDKNVTDERSALSVCFLSERFVEPKGRASHAVPLSDSSYSIDLTVPFPSPSFLPPFPFLSIMSSSSSQAASASRSPSPTTPSTPDSSDNIQVAPFRNTVDLSTWYKTLPEEPISPSTVYWDESSPRFSNTAKDDGANILSLDDLIQDYAYDEYVPLKFKLLHTRGLNIHALVPHPQVYRQLGFLPPFLRSSTPLRLSHLPPHSFSPVWIIFHLPSQWFPPGFPYLQQNLYLLRPHNHEKWIIQLLRP